ncbi:hypothetical protein F511_32615 [Dorcoceras hygrometricum]|uniref:Uncharacterized protein n=1 Tax=Dorcoceras hygrometricum TaxID=472368 RepID=A0A2Z7AMI8_9LAMI|nr:hypothetical protein F511_32615 [Dorcoceras hygrometricum]
MRCLVQISASRNFVVVGRDQRRDLQVTRLDRVEGQLVDPRFSCYPFAGSSGNQAGPS